ncbi:MAG: 16S rRNA (uracil(1498)-N(3))-methyltransferase [bacterium]|nr:16S rRNA (uracil(1498)-N(3))-methyltransferase [bacterium]
MKLLTFYDETLDENTSTTNLGSIDEIKHFRAHRLKLGDCIRLVNGKGIAKLAKIVHSEKRLVKLEILHSVATNEPIFKRILLLANISHDALETAYANGIALGMHQLMIFQGDFSQSKEVRFDRMKRIGLAAMKQCHRSVVPEIFYFSSLEETIQAVKQQYSALDSYLYCNFHGVHAFHLIQSFEGKWGIVIAIGPEGGFSDKECRLFEMNSFQNISLGKHILRSELAVATALSLFCHYP